MESEIEREIKKLSKEYEQSIIDAQDFIKIGNLSSAIQSLVTAMVDDRRIVALTIQKNNGAKEIDPKYKDYPYTRGKNGDLWLEEECDVIKLFPDEWRKK
jgi:hypothetical protein